MLLTLLIILLIALQHDWPLLKAGNTICDKFWQSSLRNHVTWACHACVCGSPNTFPDGCGMVSDLLNNWCLRIFHRLGGGTHWPEQGWENVSAIAGLESEMIRKMYLNDYHLLIACRLRNYLHTGRDRLRLTALTTNHHGGGANREFWKTLVYTSDAHVQWNTCDRWSSSYHDGIYFASEEFS